MYSTLQKRNPTVSGRKRQNVQIIIYPKTGRSVGRTTSKKKKPQANRRISQQVHFEYAGRDTLNQVGKIAPKIINQTTGEINKIAQERIDQIIRSGGAKIELVVPKNYKGSDRRSLQNTIQNAMKLWENTISKD